MAVRKYRDCLKHLSIYVNELFRYCLEKRVSCVNFFLFCSFNEIFFMKTEIMNIHFFLVSPKCILYK